MSRHLANRYLETHHLPPISTEADVKFAPPTGEEVLLYIQISDRNIRNIYKVLQLYFNIILAFVQARMCKIK